MPNAFEKKRIFVIDDDVAMIKTATKFLELDHHIVHSDTNPRSALQKVRSDPPDLVLLDVCMEEMDGLEVCRQIKLDPKISHVPIIMMSAKSEEADVVVGLELGAEDYIRKPFGGPELRARVKTAIRRQGAATPDRKVAIGPLRLDYGAYKAWLEDKELDLTPKQFELLGFFLRNESRVLTRGTISENVWGADLSGSSRAVDSAVDQLRKKLGRYRTSITSLKGVGYRFEIEE